ncbi:glycan metabolism protein RagB [Niastella yeongjuensis]|uniref:Glycan metabolism protein RagB n=1 Tax=Niastella yeongjuensis TaxID=354355 RepID=A0A1V9EEF7_9BACT|nr:RagB/SusD family nutrient uptake outer membrane protein [Niastella yeongjuensis]OQP44510.1 glycan metabolism protein RagB [Niastella yeongjuensis]SEO85186.1 SusD family protein [Niastella yeongjuensis]
MKKHIILSIAILSALTACKKSWLEIVPQGQLVSVTTNDYDKLMNDPNLYIYYSTGGFQEPQLMGDEVAAEGTYFASLGTTDIYRQRFFQWADSIYPTADATPFALRNYTQQMYEVNKIIAEVMASPGGSDEQKKAIRAEAQATRAFFIFNLANYYCKPYLASTAGTDPGFPFTTEPSVTTAVFKRGTLQETYDFIIKDLQEALQYVPAKQAYVTRMSKPAVEGLLGKVYLFMGRYNDALPLLKAAMADVAVNGQTVLYNYNQTLAPGGAFLPANATTGPKGPGQNQTDVTEAVISKVFNCGAWGGNQTGNNGLVLTPQAQALYGSSDWRLLFYTNKNKDNSINAAGRLRKYGYAFSRFGLQLPELYLLTAEAKARANDLTGAVTDVETLRRNRMPVADAPVPVAIAGNQTSLIKFIIDERIREFAMEGYRWFDMRRLSVDPIFAGMNFTHTIYNADGTATVYTLKQPNRLVLQFPRNITDANPGMENNP